MPERFFASYGFVLRAIRESPLHRKIVSKIKLQSRPAVIIARAVHQATKIPEGSGNLLSSGLLFIKYHFSLF